MATWVGCASANFSVGRAAEQTPGAIVIHRTERTLERLRARFNDPLSLMSAHYAVSRDGAIEQYVSETDTAFHAGTVINPTWQLLKPRVNPNAYTVAIELEGSPADACPPQQLAAASRLLVEIASRWGIPLHDAHVIPHRAIRGSADCPGSGFDLSKLLALAGSDPVSLPAKSPRQTVRVLVNANLRRGTPHRSSPVVSVVTAGTDLPVSGFTPAGERVNGNACWYVDGAGDYLWAGATDAPRPAEVSDASDGPVRLDEMDAVVTPPAASGGPPAIDRSTHALPAHQYYAARFTKDLIVLHFTAGRSAKSAVDTWKSNAEHVATAYVIDLDGTIYETFSPEFWAYHLGIKGGTAQERRSIGIEIVNVGPLQVAKDRPGVLTWWPRDWNEKFCQLDEPDKYVESAYRGKRYFARFGDAQMDATARLVNELCERFSIPRRLPGAAQRLEKDASFASFSGVATHANFRDDKWDVGPAFDFDRLAF